MREIYSDEQKILIAYALILWRGRSVSDIRPYVDGDSSGVFAEVLTDLNGPIFYYKEKDQIVLRRWVKILLGEGKDSKQLTTAEEIDLQSFLKKIRTDYHQGYITPKELRELAGMGSTSSEKVLSSTLLKKWNDSGVVSKERRGLYKFTEIKTESPSVSRKEIMEQLIKK